ncbi:hypothetical protein P5V15_001661 [Pogonomyrmex californicus]
MINVVDRYFSVNRTLLLAVGLWPYQKSKFSYLQSICIFSILITNVIFQLTTIMTSKCNANLVIKVFSTSFAVVTFIIKYNSFNVNRQTIKYLMEQIQHIYKNLRDNNEIAIVERYGSNAKHYTRYLAILLISSASVSISALLWPVYCNIILFANESQPRRLQISTEYFIDQEKYFYLLLLHLNATVGVGFAVVLATGAMLIAYYEHACGMFKIASYRIDKAIQIYISKDISLQKDILLYKGIIHAVDIHRKAMKFCIYLISRFEISFMLLIIFGVISLSLNIFRIFQVILSEYDIKEFFICLTLAFMCTFYMFLVNLVGQQIIDHNNHVFITAYKIRWYKAPLNIQKMILFLLQRGNKSFDLTVGGLFIASLECFATMINVVDRYFSLNRTLLLVVGLWPYQKSKFFQFQLICIFSILITNIIFQLTTIMASKCNANFVIKVLSNVFAFSTFVVKYISFNVNRNTIRYLMEQIEHIYKNLRDTNEVAIIEKYANNAKHHINCLTIIIISSAFIFMSALLWPIFCDMILSANESRSHHLLISTEYFIDQERYFYLFLLHLNATLSIGLIVLLATGSMLIVYFEHACGIFKIASYRIDRAIQIYISKDISLYKEILVYKGIIHAVDIHRKAMRFSTYLISRFEISFMFLIMFGVSSLSLNIFRIFQIVLFGYNTGEFLICLVIIFICIFYMFIANLIGQQIIDHNNHVFVTAYNIQWYLAPLNIQKLILILIQRGNKNFGLNVGGLFLASLECFATLANSSISYFVVMYSTR